MIHESKKVMWFSWAAQMKSPQPTNIGFCVFFFKFTRNKESFHTAGLEIVLSLAKSTLPTPPQPLSL